MKKVIVWDCKLNMKTPYAYCKLFTGDRKCYCKTGHKNQMKNIIIC